jgi:cytochrome c-type biogenesis protein CcmE
MNVKTVKIGATAAVLVASLSGLMYTTLSEGTEYYKHVEEVMANPQPWHGKKLQLHGFASDVRIKPDTLDYRFVVESGGHKVHASYTGIVPDTFKNGAEVVLKGTLGPDGFRVTEDGIMAKCPSKYEPGSGGGSPKGAE